MTPATKARILALAKNEHLTYAQIGRQVGISQPRVSQVLTAAGVRRGQGFRPTQTQERNAEMRRLYATGKYTHSTLAQRFGLSRPRVHQIVNKLDRKRTRVRATTAPVIEQGPSSPVPTSFADKLRAKIQDLTDLLTRVEQFEQRTGA